MQTGHICVDRHSFGNEHGSIQFRETITLENKTNYTNQVKQTTFIKVNLSSYGENSELCFSRNLTVGGFKRA